MEEDRRSLAVRAIGECLAESFRERGLGEDLLSLASEAVATRVLDAGRRKTLDLQEAIGLLVVIVPEEPWLRQPVLDSRVASGVLVPVKRSGIQRVAGVSGYCRYRLNAPTVPEDVVAYVADAAEGLSPMLRANAPDWLQQHPEDYLAHEADLSRLSLWLATTRRPVLATRRERSYEVFGDEKALDHGSSLGRVLASGLRLDLYGLLRLLPDRCHGFESYLLPGSGMVLVLENQDPYHDVREVLRRRGKVDLLGSKLSGAVFGGGYGAVGERDDLGDFLRLEGVDLGRVRYVGDVDADGVAIAQRAESSLGIRPFAPMYALMLSLHVARRSCGLPLNSDAGRQGAAFDLEGFVADLSLDRNLEDELRWCLANGVRVPQEIVSFERLEAECHDCE